jgi:hypothetical protein
VDSIRSGNVLVGLPVITGVSEGRAPISHLGLLRFVLHVGGGSLKFTCPSDYFWT